METYSSFQKPFMYFWLKYCDKNHIERIPVAVKDIDHLLLLDGTRIDDNEYLSSLENGTKLIVCTEEQIQKLLIYFLSVRHRLFSMILKNNFDIYQSGYKRYMSSLVKSVFLTVFKYDF